MSMISVNRIQADSYVKRVRTSRIILITQITIIDTRANVNSVNYNYE